MLGGEAARPNIASICFLFCSMSANKAFLRVRTIAVVGAGPSGITAAKYLRAEKSFDRIVLFEQRSKAGGIWNYTGDQRNENMFSIPQTNPNQGPQKPEWPPKYPPETSSHNKSGTNGTNGVQNKPSFLSPLYETLETNIPRGLMGFQDLEWPSASQLFPKHETVLHYIEDYGKDVQDLVQYETQVLNVVPTESRNTDSWTVTTQNIRSKKVREERFDAVIVANGHFIVPYVPTIEGMKEWNDLYPGCITHSKYFRRAQDFSKKKVVVVGNSASGADISNQIAAESQTPLLWSSRSTSLFTTTHGTKDPRRQECPPISQFLSGVRGVLFADGKIESDIDAVVFATGYLYSLPFLEDVEPALITDGSHVKHTYQHILYAPKPTLSFLVLNQRVVPFPLAEAQAAVLARVYSGRLALPSQAIMQAWEQNTVAEMGDGRNFHLLPFPKDGNYLNAMSRWALSAKRKEGLENDGRGKVPPIWGDWQFWCRENFPAIRRAFGNLGCDRFNVQSIEEVGFSYEEYLKKKEEEEMKKAGNRERNDDKKQRQDIAQDHVYEQVVDA